MIEINFLSDELRRGQKTTFNLPPDFLKKIIKVGACVIILPIILIPALIFTQSLTLKRVNKDLNSIAPQREQIDRIREESDRHKALEKLFSSLFKSRLSISPKLNSVSDSLPQGMWLDEFSFFRENWEIKGQCFSASSSEMAQIGQFLNALKSNKDSTKALAGLELSSVRRFSLGPTEIVEFIINSKKFKDEPAVKKKEAKKTK